MTDIFRDNKAAGHYELDVDGIIAYAKYRINDATLYIDYVEAPHTLRGTGAAGRLMENIRTQAQTRHLKIVPICGYAAAWLRRYGENIP